MENGPKVTINQTAVLSERLYASSIPGLENK
jgi:hypothetical protein